MSSFDHQPKHPASWVFGSAIFPPHEWSESQFVPPYRDSAHNDTHYGPHATTSSLQGSHISGSSNALRSQHDSLPPPPLVFPSAASVASQRLQAIPANQGFGLSTVDNMTHAEPQRSGHTTCPISYGYQDSGGPNALRSRHYPSQVTYQGFHPASSVESMGLPAIPADSRFGLSTGDDITLPQWPPEGTQPSSAVSGSLPEIRLPEGYRWELDLLEQNQWMIIGPRQKTVWLMQSAPDPANTRIIVASPRLGVRRQASRNGFGLMGTVIWSGVGFSENGTTHTILNTKSPVDALQIHGQSLGRYVASLLSRGESGEATRAAVEQNWKEGNLVRCIELWADCVENSLMSLVAGDTTPAGDQLEGGWTAFACRDDSGQPVTRWEST